MKVYERFRTHSHRAQFALLVDLSAPIYRMRMCPLCVGRFFIFHLKLLIIRLTSKINDY